MSARPATARPDAVDAPEAAYPLAELPLTQPLNALAIDTSSDVLGLALLREGTLAGAQYDAIGRRTTQEILPRIGGLLAAAGLSPAELDVLVVARGPGSFTGTRIGMAVALTFAQVTGCPLVGVDTLRVLAAQAEPVEGGAVPVLLNCARDEVYFARYRWQGGALARETGMALRRLESLLPELAGAPVRLRRFNPGMGTSPEQEAAFAALPSLPLRHSEPDAVRLMAVGLGRYLAEPGRDWRHVEPIYLKSEAFRTWRPAT
ncbi:MAG TPA: tRNA (adenosine(37)-N6)-threonylcarbamoyltransferase complex dimerization subunit type 1 TsaB [bacterium]|nr:tRNA (adenosine(37)-N6)-threonylcarbamoyltransferase complex dimerization subunit type 1 TsaB [bacterium]